MIVQIVQSINTWGPEDNVLVASNLKEVKDWAENQKKWRSPVSGPPALVDFSKIRERFHEDEKYFSGEFKIGSSRYWLSAIDSKGLYKKDITAVEDEI